MDVPPITIRELDTMTQVARQKTCPMRGCCLPVGHESASHMMQDGTRR